MQLGGCGDRLLVVGDRLGELSELRSDRSAVHPVAWARWPAVSAPVLWTTHHPVHSIAGATVTLIAVDDRHDRDGRRRTGRALDRALGSSSAAHRDRPMVPGSAHAVPLMLRQWSQEGL